jgi:hypothetical protein
VCVTLSENVITVSGRKVLPVLDLRVQPGGLLAGQSMIDYGQSRGVKVRVREYPNDR